MRILRGGSWSDLDKDLFLTSYRNGLRHDTRENTIGFRCASKEEYLYGLKAHTVVTASGRPVEVLLLCGYSADLTGMKEMALD